MRRRIRITVRCCPGRFGQFAPHITDEVAFYRAMGEAINGPGGYFGRNLDALDDCLRSLTGRSPVTGNGQ
ncbi:barstar family protein [Nonomuraea sp. 10N515B]|uniref:barstar family protein n=1 Tax=Nonomuraea sp. 10N515B TaxID=3457422 RepID=UPI003FCDFF4E